MQHCTLAALFRLSVNVPGYEMPRVAIMQFMTLSGTVKLGSEPVRITAVPAPLLPPTSVSPPQTVRDTLRSATVHKPRTWSEPIMSTHAHQRLCFRFSSASDLPSCDAHTACLRRVLTTSQLPQVKPCTTCGSRPSRHSPL